MRCDYGKLWLVETLCFSLWQQGETLRAWRCWETSRWEKRSPASMERISLVMGMVTVNVKHVRG